MIYLYESLPYQSSPIPSFKTTLTPYSPFPLFKFVTLLISSEKESLPRDKGISQPVPCYVLGLDIQFTYETKSIHKSHNRSTCIIVKLIIIEKFVLQRNNIYYDNYLQLDSPILNSLNLDPFSTKIRKPIHSLSSCDRTL